MMTVRHVGHVGKNLPAADGDSIVPGSAYQKPVMSIEMRTMASATAIPTIRTVAADLAARADFDLDSIDDLRMAVDDVCAMLVRAAAQGGALSCRFTVSADRIDVAAEVAADHLVDPLPTGSFDRRVLESLVDEVSCLFLPGASSADVSNFDGSPTRAGLGTVHITLTKSAPMAPPP